MESNHHTAGAGLVYSQGSSPMLSVPSSLLAIANLVPRWYTLWDRLITTRIYHQKRHTGSAPVTSGWKPEMLLLH